MSNSEKLDFVKERSSAERIRLELISEWKDLWEDKYDDKKLSEGISTRKYSNLEVTQGQVIYATRKCESLDFYEILEDKIGKDYNDKISPSPKIGGWRKFAKNHFSGKTSERKKPKNKFDLSQQQRKHGKGWLNRIRISKKLRENNDI